MNSEKKGPEQHKDGRKTINLDSMRFPRSLRTREGWSKYLDSQLTSEPFIHQIEPTNHCKYKCIMCPRSEYMTRSVGFMEFDLFAKIINEISGFASHMKEREIELFHFGESLMHPRLAEMVGYAADHDLKIALSVNGQDLTPERAKDMLENGVHRIIISLDGYDEQSMRQIRGKRANYKAAVENIESLISIRKETRSEANIEVRMIQMNINDSHAEEFVKRWSGKGLNVAIRAFFPWSEAHLADLGEFEKYPPGLPCPFPWEYMVVQWNGDVVGCCRDYNAENVLGNVSRNSLKEIWNGSKLHKLRDQLRTGDYLDNSLCRKCMSLYYTEPESQSSARPSKSSQTTKKRTHSEFLPIRNENGDAWNAPELLQDSIDKTRKAQDARLKREILYWSAHCSNTTEIKAKLDLQYEQLSELIKDLVQDGYLISNDEMDTEASSSKDSVFYPEYDLNSIWEFAVKSYGNHVYITDENHGDLSFGEADDIKQMVSSRLLSAGVGKGDRVVLCSAVNSEALILFWAIVGCEAILVPIDHDLPAGRVRDLISQLTPKLVFVDRERAQFLKDRHNTIVFDDISASSDDSFISFAQWLEESESTATDFSINSANLVNENAAIILTSGTSSQSKAVCLTHGALSHSAHLLASSFSISSHDRLFILGDLHTISGLRNSVIVPATCGCRAIIAGQNSRQTPELVIRSIREHGVTVLATVPMGVRQMLLFGKRKDIHSLDKLRQVLSTADRLPGKIREDFNEQFGVPIRTYFGLTETAGICAAETSANHKRNADGGIGNPVDALFRVVDDEGYDLPAGEKGALWIQSANLMQGYYLNEKATGQSFNGRWFKTGDLAVRHTDGSYSIIGRINDQAKNNYGEILDASGVIDYLLSREDIEDAETCSIRDRQGDNRLACFIVFSNPKKNQNQSNQVSQLRSQLADKFGSKNLPYALVQIDKIPRNSNGKPIISELINKVGN